MKIMLIIGSVREGRIADKVAGWVTKAARAYPEIELDVADLKEIELPFYNLPELPVMLNGHYDNPMATAWAERVAKADGFIFLVAEYNHGYTPPLKNAIDWVSQGWNYKPVSFVSYGGVSGGSRAVEQLREVVSELRMFDLREAVHLPFVRRIFEGQDEPREELHRENLKKLFDELTSVAITKKN